MRVRKFMNRFGSAIFLIVLAIFLRWHNLTDTVRFRGDQGLDMLIVWFMENAGHRPIVGPFLSLQNVFTPPTYYYLIWFFHSVTGSIIGIVMMTALMNIVAMILLMHLTYQMAGKRASIIMGMLFSVSHIMIFQSRTFWQPFLIHIFLTIYLSLLWHAFTKKSIVLLWLSTFAYHIALSIYPSPILLFPFVLYQVYRWYRVSGKMRSAALIHLIGMVGMTAILFTPQLVYEISNDFPTIMGLQSEVFIINLRTIPLGILANIFRLIEIFWGFTSTNDIRGVLLTFAMAGSLYVVFRNHAFSDRLRHFFNFKFLMLGLGFLAFYPQDIHSHRMWSYLPFFYLGVTLALDRAYQSSNKYRIGSLICICVYMIWNLWSAFKFIVPTAVNELKESETIARYIRRDIRAFGLSDNGFGVFHKVPNDPTNGSYDTYRVLYFLEQSGDIHLTLTSSGNNVTYDYTLQPRLPVIYLICRGYPTTRESSCIREAEYDKQYAVRSKTRIGLSVVNKLTKIQD